ncbi:MAG: hypothetical protein HY671_12395 [Chloroflexi bacterium]|nr:hypothetical protein [Chloroflexota bacterium]
MSPSGELVGSAVILTERTGRKRDDAYAANEVLEAPGGEIGSEQSPKIINMLMKRIMIFTIVGLLAVAFFVLLMFPVLWPRQDGLWSNVASELFGFAVSIPIIYLIVEKAIDADREKKWSSARKGLFRSMGRQIIGILNVFASCRTGAQQRSCY